MHKIAFYLNTVLLGIGILGNAASAITLFNKTLRKRKFNWYLLTLTVFEFFFCLISFTDYIFILNRGIFLHDLHKISFIIIDFTVHTSDCCVVILTLLLSADRLYAIKNPMKIKEFITNLHAKKTIFLSLLLTISLNVLNYVFCELIIGNKALIFYCSIVSPLLFHLLPSLIILILNGMLEKEMYYANRQTYSETEIDLLNVRTLSTDFSGKSAKKAPLVTMRRFNSKESSKFQKSHYVVIFVLSIWTTLTTIPYYLFNSYFSLFQLNFIFIKLNKQTITTIQIISSVFFNSNHCINFFIYLSFYTEFRNILKSAFLKLFSK